MPQSSIRITGARQNNLQNLSLELPLGELIVITGVSGSGKSSLAFDTVYAEGQRRYVETFSPYARQFLDRMDRPATDRIEGVPPAIAIDQTNPVRTSRSTVGTMTELNDHLKLLFSRLAEVYCQGCGRRVQRNTAEGIVRRLLAELAGERVMFCARLAVPKGLDKREMQALLERQGYSRFQRLTKQFVEVIVDRVRLDEERRDRLVEAAENGLHLGQGHLLVYPLDADRKPLEPRRFSADLHCPDCDMHYREPVSSLFSFNSPLGACETCRGFGRIMGIDLDLVIPDPRLSLAEGAIRPWQSGKSADCQKDLMQAARRAGVATDIAWQDLPEEHRRWVLEGDGQRRGWYGVDGFFDWLESKSYKMHVRVLLSKYRSYDHCPDCEGARLKPEALAWRIGRHEDADRVLAREQRFRARTSSFSEQAFLGLPGLCLHDVMQLPLARCRDFFDALELPGARDEAASQVLDGIRQRLRYLCEVGLPYLTLDRQSRTLSGGEVQRINLTTALGTSLVNTLFVLDEPSIGLHPRDMQRIIRVMQRLRDAGNSLLVVEHDPDVMRAADRLIDIGPGPGARGGRILYDGPPAGILERPDSLTGAYLSGRERIRLPAAAGQPPADLHLTVRGARAHNLQDLTVRIPLQRLVVLTGVSGSGKSTLMQEVLYNGLRKQFGQAADPAEAHDGIDGGEAIDDVVYVDQSAIGKTTRSNPASFVGALEPIRKLFAATPEARTRGYTPGTFSFNSGNGRCPGCGGNGFEHVEMQFLSDVYLRCPDCNGRRYREDVLEITLPAAPGCPLSPQSMADVLALTVEQATDFFADQPEVLSRLEPLRAVGLSYMGLGQAVPTLSGGEAQRLKLAGHLAASSGRRRQRQRLLFLLDEPTTGLHFADVAVLLQAFRRLLDAGHSLLVIEHNVDVMRAADWLIDLGPEGGDGGGRLVAEGTPAELAGQPHSHTGRALASAGRPVTPADRIAEPAVAAQGQAIRIRNAREHNLKGIDLAIPRDRFTVITGLSGSGKSTVAFDILFTEGQRRYLESLNAYARQFVQPASRPDVDAILGIPPTVAIEQRTSRGGRKSTVGTMTEIQHFLRLLYVKLGHQYCPDCDIPIRAQSPEAIVGQLLGEHRGETVRLLAPLVVTRKGYYTDLAQWAAGKGFETLRVDGEDQATGQWPRLDRYQEHTIELPVARLQLTPTNEDTITAAVEEALKHGRHSLTAVFEDGSEQLFSSQRACPGCQRGFAEPDPRLFSYNSRHGWCPECFGTGLLLSGFDADQTGEESAWRDADSDTVCHRCEGRRLNPEALAVRFQQQSIADLSAMTVEQANHWFGELQLSGRDQAVARDILPEIRHRLAFLGQVGLAYLGLDRAAPTLSGGEAQRIRLAAQLGSNLQGVCYVLDEPTIGLHPRDNRMLLDTLSRLEGKGNTVVVVEHDEDTIRRADHVIDLGPGAGVHGGRVVAEGTVAELLANPDSPTGRALAQPFRHPLRGRRREQPAEQVLRLRGARANNLQAVDLDIPLGRLIVVSGVSGSGKSTLVRRVLRDNLQGLVRSRGALPSLQDCAALDGWKAVARVLEVDQTPIGKTPRSCPATYIGFWDAIRQLFAQIEEARIRGYGPGRFSFNTRDGRCSDCDGQGVQRVEMSFLPDVELPCDSCGGKRFSRETLSVTWRDRSAGDVLAMSVDEAVDFFGAHNRIHHPLSLLQDVGLGYLTLGQRSPTLSGGEAQRIKLVSELAKVRPDPRRLPPHTLYLLDEPTVGLHMADVEKLIRVLHRLVDAGHTVIVIEHSLEIMAEADWLIDMGPEGGEAGGRVVAAGVPETVVTTSDSHTARLLKEHLARSATP
ncbi:excinuclease ABC subunit UvrA [Methylonatrum kenyense]|uniref:excinuclease ABC subunit UvrA n=1 Tax=Methylonatrum kenyense TaxID=455253 RepID=UPI0020C0D79B|nr:excinuclease ABC subunit UvrA [Methylonatrum kenyense]MCK8516216.1 excinuclease ABC subunit UvrA [Methylonatrum kenyense]